MKAFKTRIYPTKEQADIIDKTIGCYRYVYNNGICYKKEQYEKYQKNVSTYDLINLLQEEKRKNEWLKEVEAHSLQQALFDLQNSYNEFYKKHKKYPKFKKKGISDSYKSVGVKYFSRHKIKIPKVGEVKVAEKIKKKWKIKTSTISKKAGKYFISIIIDYTPHNIKKQSECVGIDLGVKTFATLSNGIEYKKNENLKKQDYKIRRLQKELSKKKLGSSNREKKKQKLSVACVKLANIRKDYINKISSEIANRYSLVAIEDLNICGMLKNHNLSKSILDCSWGLFIKTLEYKCKWYNCDLIKIGRFEPSSKLCSNCGYKMDKMPLNIRKWDCPICGSRHNRDLNAAKNILKIALSGREEEPADTVSNSLLEQENFD